MSIFGSVENLAFALHRKGYSSDEHDRVQSFVSSHRVDLLPLYLTDGQFTYGEFLIAIDAVAKAGTAIDAAKAFQDLAIEIENAEDQITNRIIDVLDDIEADEKEAA